MRFDRPLTRPFDRTVLVLDLINAADQWIPGFSLPVDLNRVDPGKFDWLTHHPGTPPGVYSDQYGTGEKSPFDCEKWPDSPFCNLSGQITHKPFGIKADINYTDCEICVVVTYDVAWIRFPMTTFCYRRETCRQDPPDPPPDPTPDPTPPPSPGGLPSQNLTRWPDDDPWFTPIFGCYGKFSGVETWSKTEYEGWQAIYWQGSRTWSLGPGAHLPMDDAWPNWFPSGTEVHWLNWEGKVEPFRLTWYVKTGHNTNHGSVTDFAVHDWENLIQYWLYPGEGVTKANVWAYLRAVEDLLRRSKTYLASTWQITERTNSFWVLDYGPKDPPDVPYPFQFGLINGLKDSIAAPQAPPLPPPDMSCDCDELSAKLDYLIAKLGVKKLPIKVSETMNDEKPNLINQADFLSLVVWAIRNNHEVMGDWPLKIQVKTDEGELSSPMTFPNISETLADIYGLLFGASLDSDAGYAAGIAGLGMNAQILSTLISVHDLAEANSHFLGYRINQVARDLDLPFDPKVNPGTTSVEKLFRPTKMQTTGYEMQDKMTGYGFLEKLMMGMSILKENTFTKATPDEITKRIDDLVEMINPKPMKSQDLDAELQKLAEEINPYLRDRGLPEIKIKEIKPPDEPPAP